MRVSVPVSLRVAATLSVVAPLLAYAQRGVEPADLIVTNARAYTADVARPLAEAFAVRGGRIVFVGSRQEASVLNGTNPRLVDAGGRAMIPGMVDAHAHFGGWRRSFAAWTWSGRGAMTRSSRAWWRV